MAEPRRTGSLGVDLGTSFSRVAFLEGGTPRLVTFEGGQSQLPTTWSLYQDGQKVGGDALREAFNNPKGATDCVKRILGRDFQGEEVARERGYRSYGILADESGYAAVDLGKRLVSPQEILSLVLARLKWQFERETGGEPELCALSVPGCFDFQQKAASMAALAPRFKGARLISDHMALLLAYIHANRDTFRRPRVVLVLDVGGGFAKAALVEVREGVLEAKRVSGSQFCAGEDIDRRLVGYLRREFSRDTGIELKRDKELIRLRDAAASIKSVLTTSLDAQIMLPDLLGGRVGQRNLSRAMSRHQFEGLAEEVLRGILAQAYDCLEATGVGPGDIDLLLLAGKVASIPAIRRGMTRLFPKEPVILPDSECHVAKGAAIFAAEAATGNFRTLVMDALPLSLGIDTGGDRISLILERGQGYPIGRKSYYTTATDNQSEMYLRMVQGDGPSSSSYAFLGNYKLSGVPPARRGQTKVEVTYQVQGDGLFVPTAKELVSGKTLKVTLDDGALTPLPAELGIWVRELLDPLGQALETRKGSQAADTAPPVPIPSPYQDPGKTEGPGPKGGNNLGQGEEARVELMKNLIPVLDNLNRALSYADPKDAAAKSLADGVGMTLKGFVDTLGKYGLKEIAVSPGDSFDPNFQEAMGFEPAPSDELADGVVARMVNKGYLYDSMLVRPIQVTLVRKNQA
ncbi:MAG: nucleotide exchange factor GrpE [Deltaproteobacteria bacterium]|jgi:molecular chaperone DnaK|nr:nucleotide exchange factor GrpE [Deltaproteobacteria bacterium]